ncbi:MFS transporter [Pseudogracilibacillus auburnensis]|uniref:MFS transporter n=1 Tax=Pseudogracilibacillus auburnensis TaxID=1494959 RepID=UPI001A96D37A|nr:MFS transporter [Pseudogracilibacillus auburnensis]MBO1003898.1 MFS transporter [Pseudogracilibacillus auburnensis]
MKKFNIALSILLMNLFIAFLGIGLVIPVLPTIMNELHLTGAMVGYLVSAFAITQLLVSPIAGQWVDTFGRKKMIVIGLFLFSLSELLFGLGKVLEVLFISRLLGGVSAALIMPAVTAFIADITTMETRSKGLGYMSAAISTGFIIGPGIGGFLAELGTRVPFFVAAVFAFIAAILSLLTLREPERNQDGHIKDKITGLKRVVNPLYFTAFLIILISSFGLAAFDAIFSLFVDHKFGFTPKDIAIVITGGAIVGAIAQVVLFDRLTKLFGEIKLICYCFIFATVFVFLITVVHSYFAILFVTIFVFVGFDLMRPAVTSYLSKVAKNEQGYVSGMNSMFTSFGNVLGPIVGGFLFDVDLDYPFYFAAIFLLIGIVLTILWKPQTDVAK